jgi:hypothetical protein
LYALHSSPDIIGVIKSRIMRWSGHVAFLRDRRNARGVLVGRPKRRRPLGRHRHRLEDNIKMDLQYVAWGGMECIDLTQDWDRW